MIYNTAVVVLFMPLVKKIVWCGGRGLLTGEADKSILGLVRAQCMLGPATSLSVREMQNPQRGSRERDSNSSFFFFFINQYDFD